MELKIKSIVNALDTVEFINAIQMHQVIWNPKHPRYCDGQYRQVAWDHIIRQFLPKFLPQNPTESRGGRQYVMMMFRNKWKKLYDSYTSEVSEIKQQGKPYTKMPQRQRGKYFDRLKFLYPTLDSDSDSSSSTVDGLDEDHCISPKIDHENESKRPFEDRESNKHATPVKSPNPCVCQGTKTEQFREKECSTKNDTLSSNSHYEDNDRMFLLSLLPDLRKIPEDTKLYVKSQILSALLAGKRELHSWPLSAQTGLSQL